MTKQNCWEFKKCGKEIGGVNAEKEGVCPAAAFELADGFCEGKNGGRACTYIIGTLCSADVCNIYDLAKKEKICVDCDFYKQLKAEYGNKISLVEFRNYIEQKKKNAKAEE